MSPAGRVLLVHDQISPYYHYIPSLPLGVFFVVLFVISTAVHFGQAMNYRLRFMYFSAVIAGLLEIAGWAARLDSHFNLKSLPLYVLQIIMTSNAPTLLIASYFMILAEIIRRLGPCYSRLQPKMYSLIFLGVDVIALSIQGVGGALAAIAAGSTSPTANPNLGAHIMLGGIVFQLVSIICYMFLATEFIYRVVTRKQFNRTHNEPTSGNYTLDKNMKMMLGALALGTLMLFIRSIYRTVELAGGWTGTVITTQIYFIVFDGIPVALAILAMNVFHPGRLLGRYTTEDVSSNDFAKKTTYV